MKKAFNAELAIVGEMQRAGVQILAGTDGPRLLVSEELELLVRAGLSPLDALRTATLNPAVFLGRTAELGSVEAGKLADLVLLTANPLNNIRAVREIDSVVFNGRYLSRAQIDALLADLAKKVASKSGKQN